MNVLHAKSTPEAESGLFYTPILVSGMQDAHLCIPEQTLMVPDSFCDLGRVLDVATWSRDVPWPPPTPEPSRTQLNPSLLSGTQVGPPLVQWLAQLCAATQVCSHQGQRGRVTIMGSG